MKPSPRMRATWLLILCLSAAGCAISNQEWALREGITYTAVYVAPQEWPRMQAMDRSQGGAGAGVCYFSPPNIILIQQGYEWCLEHELSHLRAYRLGIPIAEHHALPYANLPRAHQSWGEAGGWGLR